MILGPIMVLGLGVGVGLFAGYKAETFWPSAKWGAAAVLAATSIVMLLLFVVSLLLSAVSGGVDGVTEFLAPVFSFGSLVDVVVFVVTIAGIGAGTGIIGGVFYRLTNRDGRDIGEEEGEDDPPSVTESG